MKAFPIIDGEANYKQDGMDLRDYFAAKAMQELLRAEHCEQISGKDMPKIAYKIADQMMEARK